jgi:hypothetical protein
MMANNPNAGADAPQMLIIRKFSPLKAIITALRLATV